MGFGVTLDMNWKDEFAEGFKGGIPIGVGYLPVAFTFGFMAVAGGLPVWIACLISLTNLTSAGQFAGTNLIIGGAGYMELALTTLVINLRYMLMSLSLSQKLKEGIGTLPRLIFSFGITDETFVVASMKKGQISTAYMLGLISMPIFGWNLGTFLGGFISDLLPESLANAMGIALYAMFIAIIIHPARESRKILYVLILAVATTCILRFVPIFAFISSGFRVIIATFVAAGFGAYFYPEMDEDEGANASDGEEEKA